MDLPERIAVFILVVLTIWLATAVVARWVWRRMPQHERDTISTATLLMVAQAVLRTIPPKYSSDDPEAR